MDLMKWPIFSLLEPDFVYKIKMACVYGNLGNEAIMVTESDEVFAIGSNAAGCLGLGDLQSTLFPKKVEVLCYKKVKGFAYGSGPHVIAFTETGDTYSWGHNGYCELGNGSSNQCLSPTVIGPNLFGKEVIEVACGSHHSLALTRDGEVYAWGQNNCGQVGSGMSTNQSIPRKVNSIIGTKRAISIACGQTSSVAVLENGEVYGWGFNGNGQLGLGNNVNQLNPCRVLNLQGIVITKVVCGYAHTMALSDVGALYVWGANTYGQLGTGNRSNVSAPVHVASEIGRIVDVAATHYNHISTAMTQNSKVYMWGQCRGQNVKSPTETPFTSLHDVFACFATPSVMWKPMGVDLDSGEKVTDSLKTAFDNPSSSDLTITVKGTPIHVHKAVLKIRCQYFRSMFQDHWEEDSRSVLEMDQFSYVVYHAFLQYLYTDEVNLPPESALELLDLANAYCEIPLKRRCEQIIKHGITIENAAMLYSTAIAYEAKELEEYCFKFSLNHMTAIIQTEGFTSLEEPIVKDFIRKAAKFGAFKS
ncbi:RCC1 and BTB domain-containing protein 1 [Cryptotermes secundus]|nr:RCC1 and BTB domain-containing protein 1 [Cryptotermes secundus]XP_033608517.1 RCC1 and BTB domain-containing protein 1 [Cryptotermes secundus]XP_033608518.1 RCC1 and BTB domain-containing protein 1 [Cryptotermes secundus]XP_033608519.1 RCC1 and BTB domain-containing protein 1 [Cryptotermes secundus]XP_033608520.1 RCC1 and BTB domain-containing protein 1 [Cryptotermes secundus]XP_033608521.1 RCC1 and BTB domain-containing protein 1 [Cryptotermes secundus]XP_033608522.1 RCC1 and BTB domain-